MFWSRRCVHRPACSFALLIVLKGDQIASLYDLLNYKDKPVAESVVPPKESRRSAPASSLGRSGASALRRTMA